MTYKGRIPFQEIPELLNCCDCLVFPSFFEGFGQVILEAMASGLPVIATDEVSKPITAPASLICLSSTLSWKDLFRSYITFSTSLPLDNLHIARSSGLGIVLSFRLGKEQFRTRFENFLFRNSGANLRIKSSGENAIPVMNLFRESTRSS